MKLKEYFSLLVTLIITETGVVSLVPGFGILGNLYYWSKLAYLSLLFQDIKKITVNISLHQPLSNVLLCSRPVLIAGLTSIFWYNPHLTHQSHSGLSTSPGSDYSLPTKNTYTVYAVVHRYLFPLCATLWRLQPSTHQEGLPSHTIKKYNHMICPMDSLPRQAHLNDIYHYIVEYSMTLLLTT